MARLYSGTYVQDALEPLLRDAADITATGGGTAVEVSKPGLVSFKLFTGAVTGTTPTLSVEVTGCDDSGFGSNVVSYGIFPTVTAAVAESAAKSITSYVNHRYLKANVTVTGTTPVFNDVTVAVRQPHDHRKAHTTA